MSLGNKNQVVADEFHPLKNNVFVSDLDGGLHITAGGVIRPDDNMSNTGIHPRWAQIWAIGPDVTDIEVGEWVLVEHARWTNSIDLQLPSGKIRIWKIDWPKSVLLATTDDPREQSLSDVPEVKHPTSTTHNIRSKSPSIIRKREY